MKTAKLLKDQIGIASGLPYTHRESMTPSQREMFDTVQANYIKRADAKLRAYDRKFSVPAQTVEVLDIYDQADVAKEYKTPTPAEIVARVRARNFDGETVETAVSISDLDIGVTFQQNSAQSLLDAAKEWMRRNA